MWVHGACKLIHYWTALVLFPHAQYNVNAQGEMSKYAYVYKQGILLAAPTHTS